MIFYFSGTGNSLHTAKCIENALSDRLVNMADALKEKNTSFEIKNGETVGFVFPVYFYGIPSVVADFVKNLSLSGQTYVYAVITCGGSIAGAGVQFAKMLSKRKIKISALWSLLMPDNYIPMYDVKTAEEEKDKLNKADKQIDKLIEKIRGHEKLAVTASLPSKIQTKAMYAMYDPMRTTKKFFATDGCISCGLCESICPTDAIKLVDGKPTWVNPKCAQCLACIHRCPARAIQYGKGTIKRNRYVHPEIK